MRVGEEQFGGLETAESRAHSCVSSCADVEAGLPGAEERQERGGDSGSLRDGSLSSPGLTLQSSASDPRSTALGLMTLQCASVPSSVLAGTL